MIFRHLSGVTLCQEVLSPVYVGLSPNTTQPSPSPPSFPRTRGVEPKYPVPTLKKIGWGTLTRHTVALAVFGVLVATGMLV